MIQENNPYDPIKEPASHRFWQDKKVSEYTTPKTVAEEQPRVQIITIDLSAYQFFRENAGNYFDGSVHYKGTIDTVVTLMDGHHASQLEKIHRVPGMALLSEQKQERGTNVVAIDSITKEALTSFSYAVNAGLLKKAYEKSGSPKSLIAISRVDYVSGYVTASQNTAEQVDKYKARVAELEQTLDILRQQAATSEEWLYAPDVLAITTKALVAKA